MFDAGSTAKYLAVQVASHMVSFEDQKDVLILWITIVLQVIRGIRYNTLSCSVFSTVTIALVCLASPQPNPLNRCDDIE